MARTAIIKHKCKHDYQDSVYGVGKRLANVKHDKADSDRAVCTVCGEIVAFKNPGKTDK